MKKPLMRYHGGKFRIAPWIISFFPQHMTYVEPFGGAAGVLLQKTPSYSEVYNDLDSDVANLFRVLRDKASSERLRDLLVLTPYARDEFNHAYEHTDDPIEKARRLIVRSYMGFGSAAATKNKTGFRIDSAREYGTSSHLWSEFPPYLMEFWKRLQGVIIEKKPAAKIIENHDRRDTLFYVDPPYVQSTRNMGCSACYRHEMTDIEHSELINQLLKVEGMVILSGYDCEIYSDLLSTWDRHTTRARISTGRGTDIRTECVWLNPACSRSQPQMKMFESKPRGISACQ